MDESPKSAQARISEPFDRSRIRFRPVAERKSKFRIDDIALDPTAPPPPAGPEDEAVGRVAECIARARRRGAPVVLCHGAHLIKNGLGPVLRRLIGAGWITHVATNGAGSIHDWEFAYLGRSTEDVRANVAVGEFGIWEETGAWIGLALHSGALEGLGYGASVGRFISEEGLRIPERGALEAIASRVLGDSPARAADFDAAAAALDFLAALSVSPRGAGRHAVPHPWKGTSVQCAAWDAGVPLTVHPGIGQDIIYSHPLLRGGAVGRASLTDFLLFASSIERLSGGVYLSVGSAIMSPMIFEKALSMARNVHRQAGRSIEDFDLVVNDLAPVTWDWTGGEPPPEHPAYYVRFCKSFSRMGGRFRYIGLDNRLFLARLNAALPGSLGEVSSSGNES
jgi:hypothetical protein